MSFSGRRKKNTNYIEKTAFHWESTVYTRSSQHGVSGPPGGVRRKSRACQTRLRELIQKL